MTDFSKHDDGSLNYKYDPDAREEINDALVDAAQSLKQSDREAYRELVKVTAEAFKLSKESVTKCFNGSRDFITKGNPRKIDGESGEKVYKMRAAFAKALILGQRDELNVTRDSKQQQITQATTKESGKKLREYLSHDYTRTQALRMRVTNGGVIGWEYARYSGDSGGEGSIGSFELDDWSATIDSWNPSGDSDFPFLGEAI